MLADRAFGLPFGWEVSGPVLAGVTAAGLLAGVVWGFIPAAGRLPTAVKLDRFFRLDDRLATADTLASGRDTRADADAHVRHDAAFAAWVQRDADQRAERLDVRGATPVRAGVSWGVATSVTGALALATILLPAGPWFGREAVAMVPAAATAAAAERAAAAEAIEEAAAALEEDDALDGGGEADALRALAEQLAADSHDSHTGVDDPGAARNASAARLNDLADRLAARAEQEERAADELARRFEGMETDREGPVSTDRLMEALQRGDLGEAADRLEEIIAESSTLTEEERRKATDQLRELSDRIRDTGAVSNETNEDRRREFEETLREQGLDPARDAEPIDDETSPSPDLPALPPDALDRLPKDRDALRELLEEAGADGQIAEDLARELEALRNDEAIDEKAARDAAEVADAIDEAAGQIADEIESGEDASGEDAAGEDAAGEDERQPTESEAAADRQQGERESAQPDDQQSDPSGDQSGEQPDERASEQSSERPGETQRVEPDDQGTENATRPDETQTQTPDGEQTPASSGDPPPEGQPGAKRPASAPDESAPDTPDVTEAPRPDGNQQATPSEGESPDATPRKRRSPGQILRDLQRQRRQARENRRAAERARRLARQLADGMDEDEQRRWAQQWQREQGANDIGRTPGESPSGDARPFEAEAGDDIDLAGDVPDGTPLLEWLSDETGAAGAPQRSGTLPARVRRARRDAERAVNESAVPSRYHKLIKQYFDRLEETVGDAPPAGAGTAQDDDAS